MSSLLTAEVAAACNALGSLDSKTNQYLQDEYTLDTIKDLIRYLRRDNEDHEIRRHLGHTKVLETDLIPILISHYEQAELFDVTLRLVVNLTNPPLLLYREEVPTEKTGRRFYLEMASHLAAYKANSFTKVDIWTVLGKRLTKILELNKLERGDELGLVIERILIIVRNILHVTSEDIDLNRPDNEASVHDQVLWALNQSGLLDIVLYMSSQDEKEYYMHIMEIVSCALKEQNPTSLADASLFRSMEEKLRDEQELLAIRSTETSKRSDKIRHFSANRHSRFGGTYVVQNMKSISENDLICHKPLSTMTSLNFDLHKTKTKVPKNRRPAEDSSTIERRSAFAIRLFLKEFCIEFLKASYNPIMYYVKSTLLRAKAQKNDETYYMWALKFFMEFNRKHNFQVKYVSETMSVSTFHYVQQQMEKCYEMITMDKKNISLWVKRLHLSLRAYNELLQTMLAMDKCPDGSVRESSKVIKSNIFYVLEYREFILQSILIYDETKMPNAYLKDLIETVYLFLKLLENFSKKHNLVIQKHVRSKKGKKKNKQDNTKKQNTTVNKEAQWDEVAGQLSAVLQSDATISTDILPFDATLETGIEEQKGDCMKKIQKLLIDFRFEDAIGLIRAAREVWPENDIFGSSTMELDEEFTVMRTIFFADIGGENIELTTRVEDNNDEEEDDEDEENEQSMATHIAETDFKFSDFISRFVHPKVVKPCCQLLATFEKNGVYTNHCLVKMMHRLAWDCKYPVMFFQASAFRTFQKILANKLDQYKELQKFAVYIVRKFVEVAENNPKVYMETLFWKTSQDAYDIEHGYEGGNNKKIKAAWTEEQENELRLLFEENQRNPATDKDVIDWIQESMIDQSKTRRSIIKKLKELGLIFKAPTKKSNVRPKIPAEFTDEENRMLMEIWPQLADDEDPMGALVSRMPSKRPRKRFVDRLLELGLIKDKKECRKKRKRQGAKSQSNQQSDNSSSSSNESDSDSDDNSKPVKQKRVVNKTKKVHEASNFDIIKALIAAVDGGFENALKWIIESIEEVALDQEAEGFDPDAVSIPIVPLNSDCVSAMSNATFQTALRCVGIMPPADEQETYWRIPGNIHFESLRKRCEMISKAIDKTLILPSNETENTTQVTNSSPKPTLDSSSDEEIDDFFSRIRGQSTQNDNRESAENIQNSSNEHVSKTHDDTISKRKRSTNNTDSESEKEKIKRPKKHKRALSILDSDSDADADNNQSTKATSDVKSPSSSDSENESRISKIIKRKSVRKISDSESELDVERTETTSLHKSPTKTTSDKDSDSDGISNKVQRKRAPNKMISDSSSSDDEKENSSVNSNKEAAIKKRKRVFLDSDDDNDETADSLTKVTPQSTSDAFDSLLKD